MKKVLLGTSALLAAGMFASAAEAAQPLKLTVGGYLNAFMGYTDLQVKDPATAAVLNNRFDVGTDGQIVFNAETKLDNGMKIYGVAEINVSDLQQADWLGDVYVAAETKWGKAIWGATDNVAVMMHNSVYDASGVWGTDKSKLVNWLGFDSLFNINAALVTAAIATPVNANFLVMDSTAIDSDGNSQKVSYITPKFAGFQAGFSWVPGAELAMPYQGGDGALESSVMRLGADFHNAYVVSAAYDNKFGGFVLGADVAYGNVSLNGSKNTQEYSAGLKLGYAGFSMGAGYKNRDYDTTGKKDDQAFDVGFGYENGPYAVSASYFLSKMGKIGGAKAPEFTIWQVSGKYKLGAGVDAFATFGYIDLDNKDFKDAALGGLANQDAWTIVTGLALTF